METLFWVVAFAIELTIVVMMWCLMAAPQPDDEQEDEIQMEAVSRMAEKHQKKEQEA